MCQRMKNRIEAPVEKLMVNEILEKTWTYLTVDFITKLLLVVGKDVILVVCNRLSKMAHFVVTTEEMTAEGLARLFRDNVWKLHGLCCGNHKTQSVVATTYHKGQMIYNK